MTQRAAPQREAWPPRFMTDEELCAFFGLPGRALTRLRATRQFPQRDGLVGRADRRAVENFFDRRAGLASPPSSGGFAVGADGDETFND